MKQEINGTMILPPFSIPWSVHQMLDVAYRFSQSKNTLAYSVTTIRKGFMKLKFQICSLLVLFMVVLSLIDVAGFIHFW